MRLFCALIGVAESPFLVEIDENDTVGKLKKVVKEEKPDTIKCEANKLLLYLAKKDNQWLKDNDRAAAQLLKGIRSAEVEDMMGEQNEMVATWALHQWIFEKCRMQNPVAREIHVLVVVPGMLNDDLTSVASSLTPGAIPRHPNRLKRWAAINAMIRQKNQKNKTKSDNSNDQDPQKKRKDRGIDSSVPYSSLSWPEIERILPMEVFMIEPSIITDEAVKPLHARIMELRGLYGDIVTGKEVQRLLFIAAVIEKVCLLLGDVKILVEEEVRGESVHVHGRFEFVLKRGNKRISIVEIKRDDVGQGMAQNIAGLEALSDVEQLKVTYGIVTDYINWVFIIDSDEKIQKLGSSLQVTNSLPTNESLKLIVGIIHKLLS